tara:strand:+ start:144 stop:269 length:126 start_codon:yes stop_codon:yes gene_type:complete
MNIAIVVVMFLAIWGWLAYEIFYAPEMDDNGNVIDRNKDVK